jgi:hypothetical protein
MKQKKKEKNYAVFYFTGKKIFFYIYDVITSPEKEKTSEHHYWRAPSCCPRSRAQRACKSTWHQARRTRSRSGSRICTASWRNPRVSPRPRCT